jgi:16S rRNA (cytosine967-C5)-methyltransferase
VSRRRGGNARLAALELLSSVLDRGLNLGEAGSAAGADRAATDPRDQAFSRHLAYGVLRWLTALEWLVGQLLQRPLKPRDGDIQRLMLIGLFQLWLGETGAHAAVNETSECARALGKPWAVGLINAVLRRFQREEDAWLEQLSRHDARLAHPDWLLDLLRADWPHDWEEIVAANNRAAPLWLRLRLDRDPAATRARLEQNGFSTADHPHVVSALRIQPAVAVDKLPGFAEGLLSVQDPAAQLAAHLLQPADAQRVLDACAAPGGKTGHLLETAPCIELTALDRSETRLGLVSENLERLGFSDHPGLKLLAADASQPEDWWDGRPYQRILLDAPCTATGVIRRHPEIKWLRTPAQLAEATAVQATLLRSLWPLLDAGGILLYATCSVLRDENDRQIECFAASHPDAQVTAIEASWGRSAGAGRQILPGEGEMDGFYYALLRKA